MYFAMQSWQEQKNHPLPFQIRLRLSPLPVCVSRLPSGAKARFLYWLLAARLKPCPDTNRDWENGAECAGRGPLLARERAVSPRQHRQSGRNLRLASRCREATRSPLRGTLLRIQPECRAEGRTTRRPSPLPVCVSRLPPEAKARFLYWLLAARLKPCPSRFLPPTPKLRARPYAGPSVQCRDPQPSSRVRRIHSSI